MKKTILFLCGIVFCSVAFSQHEQFFEKDRKTLRGLRIANLKSRSLTFEKKDFSLKEPVKRIYLKLKKPLTKSVLRKLQKNGIELNEYVTDETYVITIDKDKLSLLKKFGFIQGFANIESPDKMSEQLYKGKINSYVREGNSIKVVVSFYEDVSLGDAIAGIRSVGGIMISNEFSLTHKLYASIPFDSLANLTLLDNVRYVEEISPPVSLQNIDAGKLSNVFWDNNGSITGLFETDFLTGSGVNVAVRDVGKIYNHQDFSGRLTTVDHDFVSSHATHVAGTIGGVLDNDGNIDTGGMAESVNLYSYSLFVVGTFQAVQEIDFTIDFVSAIETYSASIINNSWGSTIGWDYYPNSRGIFVWDWRDTIHLFGKYTSGSEDMDDFMHDYYDNDALILKAAGNERDDEDDDPNDLNNHPHDGEYYSDSEGLYSGYYYCLEPLSCAKNIITIGAVGTDNSENESTSFSSWGPTGDGRVKPDVVADGFELLSTWVDNGYNEDDGTSMACPVVTGISALIFQEYKDSYGSFPTADIVKALLCNYAMDQGNPGPDFSYGFGIVDAKASIECIQNLDGTSGGHIITSSIDETGSSLEYQLTILENDSDNESLRITLCWIDPPGNPQAVNAIVNDLDLVVVDNDGVARYPFYFKEYDASPLPEAEEPTVDPTEPAKIGFNRYDTVEQVIIEADNENRLAPGTYNVRITGFKLPYLNQPFAVVSSVGFDGFHFNTLRIKNPEGEWVTNHQTVLDQTPDVLLRITELGDGFNPATLDLKYSFSRNGGVTWSTWEDVDGIYEDDNCTTLCTNPCVGVSYAKVGDVQFETVSLYENRIRFRAQYDGDELKSGVYIIRNNNIYYVSSIVDNDSGTGTQDDPWKTISHALITASATAGVPAYIYVQAGTYNENIVMKRHVSLYGGYDENWARDIELNETIIDGQASSNVVIADNDSILDGFTIQNGKAEQGGGIYIKNVSSIISNCIVKNNVAHNDDHGANDYSDGAGLYAQNAGGTIKNCTFIGNYHSGNAQQSGGAIMLSYSSMLIENCIFENNYCPSTGDDEFGGGAIYNFFSIATIKNCKFAGNYVEGSSSIAALGGAIFSNNGSISKIIGCLFDSNRANKGSAAYGWGISLINCTVYNNISAVNNEAFLGVGPLVTNCIFLNNNYNDFSGFNINQSVTYSCIQDVGGGAGTIHVDPQLRDPDNGDFRLKITSPCVDTGTNSATYLDELTEDIHGESRIFGFITDNTVDMGADELHWEMIGIEHDNEDAITIEFQSFENDTYFVEYLDDDPSSTMPILHYRMNDNDSNTTVDERMGSVNGTFIDWESNPDANTDVHAVSGKSSNLNTALKFSGDKEFINCGNVANLTENFSFAFWAYLDEDTYSANRNIVNKADNSSWRIRVDQTTGKMRLILNFGSGAISYVFNHVFSTETWQHIVVLLNTTNGDANLYVNGTFEETISIQSSSLQSNSGDFKIGTFSTEAWLGMIDDVRVYDHLLTTPEIGFIYNHGNGTEESVKWHRVTTSVIGQEGTTSWTDDGSETSPAPDNDGVTQRLYRVVVGD